MAIQINLDHLNIAYKYENLSISVSQISYGIFNSNYPMHQHSNSTYEFHLISGGEGTLVLNTGSYELHTGNLYMTGPGIAHEQLTNPESPMREYCIALNVKESKKVKPSSITKLFIDTHFWFGTDYEDNILLLFQKLEQESSNQEIGYAHNVTCIITEMIIELVRNYSGRMQTKENQGISLTNKRSMIIDQCFISQYATITEKELCELLAISSRQLQRFLKNHYGKTFMQMRQTARIAKAHELYKNGCSLEEIAVLVGYNDLEYLKQLLISKH